ncbi:Sir2 family histone deacetylase Hst2 [Schizosaccharomyces japonicus yFS275]|uniref:NAD-dependent protein deacetylase n=1 Tax=Schizosaccharomyces japonicus (strain yFS275 / FY16936) TaxID=402676 RepID=B6JXE7_SCHJY|nr:Sir2 family histone deacetylase Hst2 [Schizosaccharomyces japonicus yFS275]EEB06048.2 Sir2 family histone deacetylase Hst2 [Schizosaccharomyces japonicus yFS275]
MDSQAVENEKILKNVADDIKNGKYKNICVMVGAGISTAAGIPDFRSPKTGIYHNLQKFNLPYAEAIFDLEYFRENPKPFFELAYELMPGRYMPTPTHYFLRLMNEKGLMLRCFTQNIDTLERIAGVPEDKIVEAHGSFQYNRCIECKEMADSGYVRHCIETKDVPLCEKCKGYVKPTIVFYGEGLPSRFFDCMYEDMEKCDLALVIGTSLLVHPFADLPEIATENCQRLLINREVVGDFSERESDLMVLGDCDALVRQLCKYLDWEKDLDELVKANNEVDLLADVMSNVTLEPKLKGTNVEEDTEDEKEGVTGALPGTISISDGATENDGAEEIVSTGQKPNTQNSEPEARESSTTTVIKPAAAKEPDKSKVERRQK